MMSVTVNYSHIFSGTTRDADVSIAAEKSVAAVTSFAIVGVLGFIINSFIFVVLLLQRSRKPHIVDMLMISQVTMDALVGACLFIIKVTTFDKHYDDSIGDDVMCKLFGSAYLEWALITCSIYNLVNITITQYLDVIHPLAKVTAAWKRRSAIVIAWPWVLGLVVHLYTDIPHSIVIDGKCHMGTHWPSHLVELITMGLLFVLTTVVPIVTFSYAFPRMTLRLSKTPAQQHVTGATDKVGVFESARRNMQRTLLLLFISYAVCILPCNVFAMLITVRLLSPLYYTSSVFHFLASLYYANIIANPFIFGFQYQRFKRALHRVVDGWRKSGTLQHHGTPTSTFAAARLGIHADGDNVMLEVNYPASVTTGEMIRLININNTPVLV